MSPTDIVAGVNRLTQNKLVPNVPKKWSEQFNFGLRAYSLKPFQSAASNARGVVINPAKAAGTVHYSPQPPSKRHLLG